MQSLEELVQEKYELFMDIQKLKRKLKIRENAFENIKKEIDSILHNEDNCVYNKKVFFDI